MEKDEAAATAEQVAEDERVATLKKSQDAAKEREAGEEVSPAAELEGKGGAGICCRPALSSYLLQR